MLSIAMARAPSATAQVTGARAPLSAPFPVLLALAEADELGAASVLVLEDAVVTTTFVMVDAPSPALGTDAVGETVFVGTTAVGEDEDEVPAIAPDVLLVGTTAPPDEDEDGDGDGDAAVGDAAVVDDAEEESVLVAAVESVPVGVVASVLVGDAESLPLPVGLGAAAVWVTAMVPVPAALMVAVRQ
jgi:hypothetical protein